MRYIRRVRRREFLAGVAGIWLTPRLVRAAPSERLLGEGRSRYNHVRALQRGSVRELVFVGDDGTQYIETRIDLAHGVSLDLDVFRTMLAGFLVQPEPRRALVLGLGGGALPNYFYAKVPGLELDVVDIDPEVVRLAQAFFGVPKGDPRYRVHVDDARLFVERAAADVRWDMIVLDAYRGVQVPMHLKTAEFHRAVLARLSPEGVVVANLHNSTRMYPYDRETTSSVYPTCYGFLSEAGNQTTLVATASTRRLGAYEIRGNARRVQPRFDIDVLGLAARYYLRRDWERVQVLRDDFPPDGLAAAAERHNGSCLRGCTYR